ncbi:hypothetical protein D3C86_1056390 [compost metagenome]
MKGRPVRIALRWTSLTRPRAAVPRHNLPRLACLAVPRRAEPDQAVRRLATEALEKMGLYQPK